MASTTSSSAARLWCLTLVAHVPPGKVGVAAVFARPISWSASTTPSTSTTASAAATKSSTTTSTTTSAEPTRGSPLYHCHAHLQGHPRSVFLVIEPFGSRLRCLRVVIGDGTLPLAYPSGAIFVNPNLLCTRLLVQLDNSDTPKEALNILFIGSWR